MLTHFQLLLRNTSMSSNFTLSDLPQRKISLFLYLHLLSHTLSNCFSIHIISMLSLSLSLLLCFKSDSLSSYLSVSLSLTHLRDYVHNRRDWVKVYDSDVFTPSHLLASYSGSSYSFLSPSFHSLSPSSGRGHVYNIPV